MSETFYFRDRDTEPEQALTRGPVSDNERIRLGFWESGPGLLELEFGWDESVYVLEGRAQAVNLDSGETRLLEPGAHLLFEKGSRWRWTIPWKIRKAFTVIR